MHAMGPVGLKLVKSNKNNKPKNRDKKEKGMGDEYRKLRTEDGRVIIERTVSFELDEQQTITALQEQLEVTNSEVIRFQQKAIEIQASIDEIKALSRR